MEMPAEIKPIAMCEIRFHVRENEKGKREGCKVEEERTNFPSPSFGSNQFGGIFFSGRNAFSL